MDFGCRMDAEAALAAVAAATVAAAPSDLEHTHEEGIMLRACGSGTFPSMHNRLNPKHRGKTTKRYLPVNSIVLGYVFETFIVIYIIGYGNFPR